MYRTTTKENWVSKQDFSTVTRKQDSQKTNIAADSTMYSLMMKEGFKTMQASSARGLAPAITEPYEDPSLEPRFVRSNKDFLKQ